MRELRFIPSIEHLLQRRGIRDLEQRYGHSIIVETLREAVETMRTEFLASKAGPNEDQATLNSAWVLPPASSAVAVRVRVSPETLNARESLDSARVIEI